jgi:putative tricarboxylic transport membrane protein
MSSSAYADDPVIEAGAYWMPAGAGMTTEVGAAMSSGEQQQHSPAPVWHPLLRKDVLSGLLFIVIALLGLWLSRDYPIGTALRMGTGYVPRLLCWILLGLGVVVLVQGLREAQTARALSFGDASGWRPVIFVTASLVIFGLSLERLGLVVSILLLIAVGAVAARGLRPLETLAAALVLIALSWAIFIVGLGLTIPVWPDW